MTESYAGNKPWSKPREQTKRCKPGVAQPSRALSQAFCRRNAVPRTLPRPHNRVSLIIASLLRTVAPHRLQPRYWQCSLLITLSRPRIAIVASGSRALHVCARRDHCAYITMRHVEDARSSGPTKARKARVPHNPTIQFYRCGPRADRTVFIAPTLAPQPPRSFGNRTDRSGMREITGKGAEKRYEWNEESSV